MTDRLSNNGVDPTRLLPVLSPLQRQRYGTDRRGRGEDFSSDLNGLSPDEDIVEVSAVDPDAEQAVYQLRRVGESGVSSGQSRDFNERDPRSFDGEDSSSSSASAESLSDGERAAAIYRFNAETVGQPFPLGGQLDLLG